MRRGVALATAILLMLAIVPLTSAEARGYTEKNIDVYVSLAFTVDYNAPYDRMIKLDYKEMRVPGELTLPPLAKVRVIYHISIDFKVVNASKELTAWGDVQVLTTSGYDQKDWDTSACDERDFSIPIPGTYSDTLKTSPVKATPPLFWRFLYFLKKGQYPQFYIKCGAAVRPFVEENGRTKGKYENTDVYVTEIIPINISLASATPLLTSLVKSKHTPAKMPFSSMLEKSKQILPVGSLIKSILNSIEEKLAERSEKTSTSERRNPAPAPTNWI